MHPEPQPAETAGQIQDGVSSPRPASRKAPAGLPPELDRYLQKLVDAAARRTARDPELKRLIKAFSTGAYSDKDLQAAIDLLDVAGTEAGPRAKVCAWLLGLPLLKPEDRARSATALGALIRNPPETFVSPLTLRIANSWKWTGKGLLALSAIILVATVFTRDWPFAAAAMFVSLLCFLPVAMIVMLRQRHKELRDIYELRLIAAHALGRLPTMEALDAVSAACSNRDDLLLGMDARSLQSLLPILTPDHYGRVGAHLVPNLCRLLIEYCRKPRISESPFAIELLAALEKVGDGRAIPAVEEAAEREHGPAPEAAERVLAVLHERKRRETERATLLRGAATPAINPSELLRPQSAGTESRAEQLLRPAE